MKFTEFLRKTKEKALNALFPKEIKCIFCGRDIYDFDITPYCEECAKENYFNIGNRCIYCDMQLPEGNLVCDFCQKRHKAFEKAFCPLRYTRRVRSTIPKLKSDYAKYLATPLSKLIFKRIEESKITIDVVLPVPVHKKTMRRRGYNQSLLLAEELAKLLNATLDTTSITKEEMTENQKELPYRKRLKNVENCFKLNDKTKLLDKNVLIVDDIMTTGSTLNAIAKLVKPHAYHVYVSAIARDTPDNDLDD